jgi:uncharacterized protein
VFSLDGAGAAVGVALSDGVRSLVATHPTLVDYVEVPFEQLVHTPDIIRTLERRVVLHCASLSLAGNQRPDARLVERLKGFVIESQTPWIGEHLAFVSMSEDHGPSMHQAVVRDGGSNDEKDQYHVGYTVSPQYSPEILERVSKALDHWTQKLGCSLLIENGPVYFEIPGSTMSQAQFISELCKSREKTRLLVDLAHVVCTAANTGVDPHALLEEIPLERVVEVHLSGASADKGLVWDDHARPIDPLVFELLERLLRRAAPKAVTLEYNWDPCFPQETIVSDLVRVRKLLNVGHTVK